MRFSQRVAEGLSEEEAWRLFNQILEALVHMGSMGIVSCFVLHIVFAIDPIHTQLHRDIKLTNIFIGVFLFRSSTSTNCLNGT